jgi:hypothetical protein
MPSFFTVNKYVVITVYDWVLNAGPGFWEKQAR